ncbi:class I SAM-dependent methyltransferase [Methanonatronarchaeum sp. AMET-Sl]|uniref:class I SAM-dependent methyltransferase n=1 Tax=Methanonatronarchaeum sp. AMET-Sl TaxID=3037654 RepID=UPI00244E2DDF|nr:class I SAM-dependent methyltransferase [Methanonatronarchaeum sp. AMET-Sl]WGI17185.1 methyltransferase domain-containing protein [Methanonatronarchaeum sp. AMET-Sl]
MNEKIEEHASRFDEIADEYDDDQKIEYLRCLETVVEKADPSSNDVVLDVGTGTGEVAVKLASKASFVFGRDISEGMLEKAIEKSKKLGIDNVDFGVGSFHSPNVRSIDIVVSNFALHHVEDEEKHKAIEIFKEIGAEKVVLGDLMFFSEPDMEDPFHKPEVDNPAYVSELVIAFTEAGYAVTDLIKIHNEIGVLVGKKI